MTTFKALWDRLRGASPNTRCCLRKISHSWETSYTSRFILDYNSRVAALGLDQPPTLSLAGHTFTFADGRWESSSPGVSPKSSPRLQQLKERMQALEEENNALKQRLDVLMDMLLQTAAQLEMLRLEKRTRRRALPKKVTFDL